ncbi:SOS response-associated peptidase [Methylocella tundrae]|uniref:Abasic site processing protein n=1 Tax=Methylocella tundrae TaxID=227605 RepID=A0A4U8YUQ8_METTU|nr:SOS response-associated peptidase [Methylocella tundrae]WPP04800.1 SOS response-associated peptidase [Methylocella tundrae]VFU07031.1 putative SOS response-associated peptidase [Methylocella tundrae]
MCGRYAITLPPEAVRRFFGYVEQPNFPPRYNIAPTQPVPIVRAGLDPSGAITRHFSLVRWGFVPSFAKDPRSFPLIINARSETLLHKASFKMAFKRRRCLFIADGFYEWRRGSETGARGRQASRPYLFRRGDGAPLGLAGVWESWIGPNGEEMDTACIITTAANGVTTAIHDRLPAIIEASSFEKWLDPDEASADKAFDLLRPPENDVLSFFEIGPAVNKTENDSPQVQNPAAAPQLQPAWRQEAKEAAKPAQGCLF